MSYGYDVAGLELPHCQNPKLQRVLAAALGQTGVATQQDYPYWDATYFGLHNVKIFQESTVAEQAQILDHANRELFQEAYLVEKAGMGYMSKMVLLADTIEERMLYGLFAADEATHLSQLSHFALEPDLAQTPNTFLRFLAALVGSQDKSVLLFVIQVVLEGWGLSHYRSLAKECRNPALGALFTSFLQAESRHHGTGVLLFNQTAVSAASRSAIGEVLTQFLQMVQVGPQGVVAAIAQAKGGLSRQQTVHVLEQLDTEAHSSHRLKVLRSLMHTESSQEIVQTLEARGMFQPLPAVQCVLHEG